MDNSVMYERRVHADKIYPVPIANEVDYVPPPGLSVAAIPAGQVISRLGLSTMPESLRSSVSRSAWQEVAGGRILLEVRNPSKLTASRLRDIHAVDTHVLDFDDCMFDAASWHRREYELVGRFGVDPKTAKEIYEQSKLLIPKVAENEPRYTPEANLILLSRYVNGLDSGLSAEAAMRNVRMWGRVVNETIRELGERPALSGFDIDPRIRDAFLANSPLDFVHDEFVEDIIGGTESHDLRIIATRGKIEGPLGQIDKVHRSGVLEPVGREDNTVDLAIYTNDIKAEALLDVLRFLPRVGQTYIRVYDDNPKEILPYIESARKQGVHNLEVIQVEHPTAKRRGVKVGVEPDFSIDNTTPSGELRTNFNHYFASPETAFNY